MNMMLKKMKNETIFCKNAYNSIICSIDDYSPFILLQNKRNKIPLEIYITKNMDKKLKLSKKIKNINKKLQSPFLIHTFDVNKERTNPILFVPSIIIDKNNIITDPNITETTLLWKIIKIKNII